jgi:hypothetical protein
MGRIKIRRGSRIIISKTNVAPASEPVPNTISKRRVRLIGQWAPARRPVRGNHDRLSIRLNGPGSIVFERAELQTRRSTIFFFSSAIALAGFSPFGQTWAQFRMVWQR